MCKLNKVSASKTSSSRADLSVIRGTFKLIFLAHNIELQIDWIDHINKIANLINHYGMFAGIGALKRYRFNHLRHLALLANVMIQAPNPTHPQGHPFSAFIDRRMSNTHNKSVLH